MVSGADLRKDAGTTLGGTGTPVLSGTDSRLIGGPLSATGLKVMGLGSIETIASLNNTGLLDFTGAATRILSAPTGAMNSGTIQGSDGATPRIIRPVDGGTNSVKNGSEITLDGRRRINDGR